MAPLVPRGGTERRRMRRPALESVLGGTGQMGTKVGGVSAELERAGWPGRGFWRASDVVEADALVPGAEGRRSLDDDAAAGFDGPGGGDDGAGLEYRSSRDLTYGLSALVTGSPSLMKLRNRLFFSSLRAGFCNGSRLTGGAPKVTQWIRLKHPARMFSSVSVSREEDSMCM